MATLDPAIIRKRHDFAVYPSVFVYGDKKDAKTKKMKFTRLKHILFGDWIGVELDASKKPIEKKVGNKTYIKVRARGQSGYILPDQIQVDRVLEVNFVDVGQGDGCHVVTPDDKHFIIDAGPSDNMYRFLKWRFNLKNSAEAPPPFTIVISHSDLDHYKGFTKIFTASKDTKQQFSIDKIYHNGLVEASGAGADSLGTPVTKNGIDYITDLCYTQAEYSKRVKAVTTPGTYIKMLNLTTRPKLGLKAGDEPIHKNGNLKIDVIGPVTQKINSKPALPVFEGNKGKTKNGHSVILKLTIGKLSMLLGGDLNSPSENYLLKHYSKVDVEAIRKKLINKSTSATERKKLEGEMLGAIDKARKVFQSDIVKSCHHGAADFTSEFLAALNPLATVISSGDDEPHCHPRPDTVGTIGKHSRGERSLIFSTELARSTMEFIDLKKLIAKREKSGVNSDQTKERVVTVYGMINVRTDGEKIILAQKLERPAARGSWDIHHLTWNDKTSEFEYIDYLKRVS